MNLIILLFACVSFVMGQATLASLEPPDGSFYLGAWYDRLNGDSPTAINARLDFKPLAFYQADINITDTLQADALDQIIAQVTAQPHAFIYLTVYPYEGFGAVSDAAFAQFVTKIQAIVNAGNNILIRYASEMNGSWFAYGQQPTAFKREWIRMVTAVRNATSANPKNVAFLWSPNDGSGYPYTGYGIVSISASDVPVLDTDKDGKVGMGDDPYSPYYPGDEYVDWVGMSIYHYSNDYPYGSNDIPSPTKFADKLTGRLVSGGFNIYEMFSGGGTGGEPASVSAGGKPFFCSETGATIFLAVRKGTTWSQPEGIDGASRASIRQAWWRQFLDPGFRSAFPKFKGAAFFEFSKYEDSEFRDFTSLGKGTNQTIPIFGGQVGTDDVPTLDALRTDLQGIYGKNIIWGDSSVPKPNATNTQVPVIPTRSAEDPPAKNGSLKLYSLLLAIPAFVFGLYFS